MASTKSYFINDGSYDSTQNPYATTPQQASSMPAFDYQATQPIAATTVQPQQVNSGDTSGGSYAQAAGTNSTGGGGGGGMGGGGYAQAGASTFNTAVNWIVSGQQMKAVKQARKEDREWAQTLRQDALKQQRFANDVTTQQIGLEQENFDFAKYRWGQEFKLSKLAQKQDYKLKKQQILRSNIGQLSANIAGAARNNIDFRNYLTRLYGA